MNRKYTITICLTDQDTESTVELEFKDIAEDDIRSEGFAEDSNWPSAIKSLLQYLDECGLLAPIPIPH
jgi:hypothetical protein